MDIIAVMIMIPPYITRGSNGEVSVSKSLYHLNALHVVPLLETKCVVDDRALAGICEPRDKESEGRTVKDIDARRWCLAKNTERKATGNHLSNFPRNTCNDDGKKRWRMFRGRRNWKRNKTRMSSITTPL